MHHHVPYEQDLGSLPYQDTVSGNSSPKPHHLRHRLKYRANCNMDDQDPHGMAAQQAAAKDYQPDLPDYLVGNKLPSEAITEEYAKADQTYIDKTIALPQKYSHYRPIQGDGNCGWRAIGFSYFEKLVENGNPSQLESEASRLWDMNPLLAGIGGYDYYEDWAEEFTDFLREVATTIANGANAHDVVFRKWNDVQATSGMMYYLRLLAATYLKGNTETYDPFIADSGGVHAYCSQAIEVVNREIEHLGIVALANVLLKPVDMVLEIAYLDRSPGSQANTYRLPEEANERDESTLGPMIHLLYRPDHYDILYRIPPTLPTTIPPEPMTVHVFRVGGFSHNTNISSTQSNLGAFSTTDFDTLSMIPGFGGLGGPSMSVGSQASAPSPSGSYQHVPGSPDHWVRQFGLATPGSTTQHTPPQPCAVTPGPAPNPPLSPQSSIGPGVPPASVASHSRSTPGAEKVEIRFSPMQLEYDENQGQGGYQEPTFHVKTSTFKNSVWNRAHFGNPDFHPEEWSPEDENIDCRISSRRRASRREI